MSDDHLRQFIRSTPDLARFHKWLEILDQETFIAAVIDYVADALASRKAGEQCAEEGHRKKGLGTAEASPEVDNPLRI